ncbi:HAMP domain-containing sensor histidine kinase [Hymenobacter ginsengisoli]|uniref:histidine kinase n=2 Tax=Hymenobacter TaxID=89966 RepID=A0ABP8QSM4_9BACT|nr:MULTISPECIES: HAMP domain-containing sensor histidine kinase [unclassified Hymenobacter]MBO2032203.1 HAMP domain-containing histidine kinase [Hymenobacter sp. BT559]
MALLLLALLSFGASWLANTYWQLPGTNPLYPSAARLQKLVNQAARRAGRETQQVALESQPPAAPNFRRLLAQCSYPTFVAIDSQLVAWSASGPAPTAAELADTVSERLSQTTLGEFLTVRRKVGRVVILTYVPLARRYGISNRYLREGAEPALLQGMEVQVRATPVQPRETHGLVAALVDTQGRYLFSVVQLPGDALTGRILPLVLLVLGIGFYTVGWLGLAYRWWQSGRVALAIAVLAGTPLVLRLVLLYLGLPYVWLEIPLFDPRIYAVSGWAPSLGDLLLNGLLAALLAALSVVVSRHYKLPARAQRAEAGTWGVPALLGLLLTVAALHSYYSSAFSNSQLSLDITQSMQMSGFRLVLLLAVLLHTAAFATGFYLWTELLAPDLRRLPRRPLLLGGLLVALLLLAQGVLLHEMMLLLPGMTILCLLLMRSGKLEKRATQGGPRYLLLLLWLSLASAVGALALYEQFERQLLLDKQRLASNLLVDNDLQGEFLLGQRLRQLASDPTIVRLLTSTPVRTEAVRRRIERQYLRTYFDKYEEAIDLFDPSGEPVGGEADDTLTFDQTRIRLSRMATPTDQAGVYLLKSDNSFSSRRYVAVIPITQPAPGGIGPPAPAGTILLTLSLKQLASYSVLPELLVDQKFFQPGLAADLSYAGYAQGRLVYSEGDFDYANNLPAQVLQDPRLFTNGLIISDFHHLAMRDGTGRRVVVVTTSTYSLSDWFSNFSFQLLLNMLVWLLGGSAYLLGRRSGHGLRLNFSARIQLLLNLGIIVPLLIVSVATASQVISGYRRDLHRTYERRGHIALESLLHHHNQLSDTTARPVLTALARNVAALTETDLNLYDARGQLLVSSQPLIFEAGLLGPLLNPQAMIDLHERGLNRTLLTEQAGTLSFSSLYLPVRAASPEGPAGPIQGYVGIPFFDSQKELDNKLTELFTTILNISTLMFLVFLGLAVVATRQLTAPLKLLTQRLMRTTLTGQNEVLDYRSTDDEIGLLVSEYNAMLGKLEASKRELATQEKEAAWREMARQVAHEIKNPLTPMKLSLQYLQKTIAERRPNAEALIGRISETLITQIDVLSDIATSFSTFTNLPTMRPARLDLVAVLRHCADLFRQNDGDESGALHLHLPPDGTFTVFADESLLVRTFNNLLLNAKQAVPPGRTPRQEISLQASAADKVLITIADNGAGIADDVRDHVFRPNFTTKATGSGIGLAVAKRGIENAGGRIWFETEVDSGTTFFIELPLAG